MNESAKHTKENIENINDIEIKNEKIPTNYIIYTLIFAIVVFVVCTFIKQKRKANVKKKREKI
jgi:hypothetical protein